MTFWTHALITGGASGLGLGLALRLLRRGTRVSVLDLALGDAARQQLDNAAQAPGQWAFASADVTDEAATQAAVAASVSRFGPPDLAIHCAGILINRAVADTSAQAFRRVVDVNLNGSFILSAAVLPHMRPGSRLALIASMAGLTSNYAYAAYGASKFGVVGLAHTLRYEYAPLGIGITCVCPPEVKTPMVASERSPGNFNDISLALKDHAGSMTADAAVAAILKGVDAGRWLVVPSLQAKLVAGVARHLPSVFFAFMNALVRREMRRRGMPTY